LKLHVIRRAPHEPVHRRAPDGRLTAIRASMQIRPHALSVTKKNLIMRKIDTNTKLSA
jgi:hypothetical protein